MKSLLQEEQDGKKSDIIIQQIVAMFDKILENKCLFKIQHKQLLLKTNLLHEQVKLCVYTIIKN